MLLGINFSRRWSDSLRAFVESSAAQIAASQDGGVVRYWDVGAAYLLTNDWQIGMRSAIAGNRNTPNTQLLLEVAGRF